MVVALTVVVVASLARGSTVARAEPLVQFPDVPKCVYAELNHRYKRDEYYSTDEVDIFKL